MIKMSIKSSLAFLILSFISLQSIANDTLISPRIVGGIESESNAYPWIVSIKLARNGTPFCGGTLIHERWVLTAAHCVIDQSINTIVVTVGEYDLASAPETPSSALSQIITHENYNSSTFDNDIALLQLTTTVNAEPISIISSSDIEQLLSTDENMVTVIGWGSQVGYSSGQSVTPDYPDILNEVELPLLSQETCSDNNNGITENMFCAGDVENGGISSCQGDSGGPLLFDQSEYNENDWQQIGIVSWGYGCAAAGNPGVYTKISNYLDWINGHINDVISLSNKNYFIASLGESKEYTITLQNQSTQTITPSFSLENSSENENVLTLNTELCTSLSPQETCDISLTYYPLSNTDYTDNIIIESSDEELFNSSIAITATTANNANIHIFPANDDVIWYQSNTAPWIIEDEQAYLYSPTIADSASTSFIAEISGDWTLNYYWAINSEEQDYLTVYINGEEIDSISGTEQFTEKSHSISGDNTVIMWEYSKNEADTEGLDSAYLYNINFSSDADKKTITPPVLVFPEASSQNSGSGGSLQWFALLLITIIAGFRRIKHSAFY